MALTVLKSIHSLNPPCLNDMFSNKCVPYRMHGSCIIKHPKRRTTAFGLRSFSYVGAKLWNELPTSVKETNDLNDFKSLLDTWNGADLIDTLSYFWYATFSYLWYTVFYVYKSLQFLNCNKNIDIQRIPLFHDLALNNV